MNKPFLASLSNCAISAVLTVVSLLIPSPANGVNKEDLIEKGKSVLPFLNEKIRTAPSGKDLCMRASIKMLLGQYQESEADFMAAEALHYSENPLNFNNMRGANFLFLKDYQAAITTIDKALKIKPNDTMALANRGCAYCQLHRYKEALADSFKAIKLDSRRGAPYETAGECYLRSGQYAYAIQYLDQSIARDPKNFESFHLRAETYQKMGKKEQAARDFAMASSLGYAPGKIFDSSTSHQ